MHEPLAQALSLLPHGPEFRFLDELLSLEPGKCGAGTFTVPANANYLKGHFPRSPLFPGVLLLEAAAQLAGVVAQSDPKLRPLKDLKLTAIRAVKILGSAEPNQKIEITAEVLGRFEGLVQARAMASLEDQTIMQGEFTLSGIRQ